MPPSSPPAAPAPRRTATWGVLVGCLVVAGLLAPLPFRGRLFEGLTDALHSPVFATLACASLLALRRLGCRSLAGEFATAGALIACGAALEWLQTFSGRSPAWHDVVANVAGVSAGTLLLWGLAGPPPLARTSLFRWPPRTAAVVLGGLFLAQGMQRGIAIAVDAFTQR